MFYPWNHTIELEIPVLGLAGDPDVDLWVFCLLDDQGREIIRDDISDLAILGGHANRKALPLYRFIGAGPKQGMVWPKRADGEFLERHYFDLPDSFFQYNAPELDWLARTPVPERSVTCEIFGGLGNQLFQVMTTLVFARNNGYTALFDTSTSESSSMVKNQDTYWDSVFRFVRADSQRYRCPRAKLQAWADPAFTFVPIPPDHDHMYLWGYFTSFRHLDHRWVREQIFSNRQLADEVDAAFTSLVGDVGDRRELVSVHVRRGDSLKNPTLEKPGPDYFRNAMDTFGDVHFVVFSDDIPWCLEHLGDRTSITYSKGHAAHIDMFMMSKCDHHIISNSTFSWWGAWINENTEARVVYPYPWFRGEKHARSFADFIPTHWRPLVP